MIAVHEAHCIRVRYCNGFVAQCSCNWLQLIERLFWTGFFRFQSGLTNFRKLGNWLWSSCIQIRQKTRPDRILKHYCQICGYGDGATSSTKDFQTTSKMRYLILASPPLFWTCEPSCSSSMCNTGNISLNSSVRPLPPVHPHHLQSCPCPLSCPLAPHPPPTLMTSPLTLTSQTHILYLPLTPTPLMIPPLRILTPHLP